MPRSARWLDQEHADQVRLPVPFVSRPGEGRQVTHLDGMMAALSAALDIADRCPGMTAEEAFWSKANLPNIRIAILDAIAESATIPFEKKH
jgi:hypothetical protein